MTTIESDKLIIEIPHKNPEKFLNDLLKSLAFSMKNQKTQSKEDNATILELVKHLG